MFDGCYYAVTTLWTRQSRMFKAKPNIQGLHFTDYFIWGDFYSYHLGSKHNSIKFDRNKQVGQTNWRTCSGAVSVKRGRSQSQKACSVNLPLPKKRLKILMLM